MDTPDGTRTHNLLFRGQMLCHWATEAYDFRNHILNTKHLHNYHALLQIITYRNKNKLDNIDYCYPLYRQILHTVMRSQTNIHFICLLSHLVTHCVINMLVVLGTYYDLLFAVCHHPTIYSLTWNNLSNLLVIRILSKFPNSSSNHNTGWKPDYSSWQYPI